jgi:restriction endonuclease S subunit
MTLFVIYQGGKIVAGLPEAFTKLKSAWTKYGKQIPAIDNEIATLEKEIQKTEAIVAKDGNRLFANIDEFKAAIGRGENVFYVGKHSDIIPRPTGVQSHHGVNTVWVKNNYVNYVEANAPSVYMLNNPNHNATRGVFNTWRTEISKVQGVNVSNIDYSKITKADILKLAERQFDAADVPKVVRDEYYKLWEDYLKTLIKK